MKENVIANSYKKIVKRMVAQSGLTRVDELIRLSGFYQKLFALILFTLVLHIPSSAQKSRALMLKQREFKQMIRESRFSLSTGAGLNTNGFTILGGVEYIAHYHVIFDATAFYRNENYNQLQFTRRGVMAGVKNSVMGYFAENSFLNLGGGVSFMNQDSEGFDTTKPFKTFTTGLYLSAEGFYEVSRSWSIVLRYDQHIYFSEILKTDEPVYFFHLGLMIRYKLPI